MNKSCFFSITFFFGLAACSSSDSACEDVTLASEQVQACQSLHRQIVNAKGQPLVRTELERRYQQDCIDLRYYRDEQQLATCGNKHKKEEAIKALEQETK